MVRSKRTYPRGEFVTILFTGAAGGTTYSFENGLVLHPGDFVEVKPIGHWLALLKSGNAEVVEET